MGGRSKPKMFETHSSGTRACLQSQRPRLPSPPIRLTEQSLLVRRCALRQAQGTCIVNGSGDHGVGRIEADHAIVVGPAAIDHTRRHVLRIDVEVEVMAHELHL
jgi:hypothetical protein